jgi:hypothetical protein
MQDGSGTCSLYTHPALQAEVDKAHHDKRGGDEEEAPDDSRQLRNQFNFRYINTASEQGGTAGVGSRTDLDRLQPGGHATTAVILFQLQ